MKRMSLIMALALAFILAIGISTAFAAGTGDGYSGPTENWNGDANMVPPLTEPAGDGYNTDQTTSTVKDAAYWGNANQTGIYKAGIGVLRNVSGQSTHGSYKANTNSCASCHMTHSAAGKQLLFKNGIAATCLACHDGTLDKYNVTMDSASLKARLTKDADQNVDFYALGGGTFNIDQENGMKGSIHAVGGGVGIKAAPGGNRTGMAVNVDGVAAPTTSNDFDGVNTKGDSAATRVTSSWNKEFSCASCHAPHGSYSDRLLHYNANNVGTFPASFGGTQKVATLSDGTLVQNVDGTYAIKNDTNPWLYGYDRHGQPEWTQVQVFDGTKWVNANGAKTASGAAAVHIDHAKADFEIDSVYASAYTDMRVVAAQALVVKFDMKASPYNTQELEVADYSKESYKTGYNGANELNKFCAACHTDYNQATGSVVAQANAGNLVDAEGKALSSAQTLRGTFSTGYRHNITGRSISLVKNAAGVAVQKMPGGVNGTSGSMACLTCHVAHGADANIQLDARNQNYDTHQTKDANASSALKRYVNMAVCWRCHTSSHATTLKNSDTFWGEEGEQIYNNYSYNDDSIHQNPAQ